MLTVLMRLAAPRDLELSHTRGDIIIFNGAKTFKHCPDPEGVNT
jgi:hypothetical protein